MAADSVCIVRVLRAICGASFIIIITMDAAAAMRPRIEALVPTDVD